MLTPNDLSMPARVAVRPLETRTIIRAPIDVPGKELRKQFCVVFVPSDEIILPRLADGGFIGVCRWPLPTVNLHGGDRYQKHNCGIAR